MSPSQLPLDAVPAWARLNDVEFSDVSLRDVEGKGFGLVADQDRAADKPDEHQQGPSRLLRVPHDLVLSADAVEDYAKVDQNFRQLLDAAGRQSARGDIMIYLLTHLIISSRDPSLPKGGTSTPWTEYTRFLPRPIPVPTMWSEAERALLQGTSLEAALDAKLATLTSEFEELREKSEELAFWGGLFWEKEKAAVEDWVLVDAWYRSRCLELPRTDNAMVPGLDMINHSAAPTAYYEEDEEDGVTLLLRPGCSVTRGAEITISYGEAKPAAEMLFSYGFIDKESAVHELSLPLDALPDDPLGKAKLHAFNGPPIARLSQADGTVEWDSAFAFFMCLNEEDGLDFRVLQDSSGGRELRVFWQDDDVTGREGDFETLTQSHSLHPVFKLRAVSVVQELVTTQLERISLELSHEQLEALHEAGLTRGECIQAAGALRDIETDVLRAAAGALEDQKSMLLQDGHVVKFLGSMEDAQNDQAPTAPANEEDDFS